MGQPMRCFYVIVNMDKPLAARTQHTVEEALSAMPGVTYEVWNGPEQKAYPLSQETDCILTIGGDGTLIRTARATKGSNIPVLGINRGKMGYLTELSLEEEIAPMLERLVQGSYKLEERMLLSACVRRDEAVCFQDIALNEVLLARQNALRAIDFEVYVNGKLLNEYCADGLLLATPTGSTAYSLSAGGPIAKPQARLLIMTPVCAHAMNARSIIFSAEDVVTILPKSGGQQISCDGDSVVGLVQGDLVEVRSAPETVSFVRLRDESFLDTLRNKMTPV